MNKSLAQHRDAIFNLIRCRVSFLGLRLIEDQVKQAKNNVRGSEDIDWTCRGRFTTQYGLPCWHQLTGILDARSMIETCSIDPHWLLVKTPLPRTERELLRILDPAVIPRRPGGRDDTSVRRDRSHDELLAG